MTIHHVEQRCRDEGRALVAVDQSVVRRQGLKQRCGFLMKIWVGILSEHCRLRARDGGLE